MNFSLLRKILEHPHIMDTHDFAVLMVLAYHANESSECWPSMEVIAREARFANEDTARVVMKRLAQAEFFTVHRGHGRGNHNRYQLHLDRGKAIARKSRSRKGFMPIVSNEGDFAKGFLVPKPPVRKGISGYTRNKQYC